MLRAHSVEVVRSAEAPLIAAAEASGDPDAVMRRAAAGLAHHTAALVRERTGGVYGRSVLLLVGSGDNGGDALYAGALLRGRGCRVDAVLLSPDRAHPRGLAALRRAGGQVQSVDELGSQVPVPDVAIDGVVGLGGSGPLRAPADRIVSAHAAAGVPWVAVDLPSGVDADTGTVHDAHVPATLTVTFGLLRRAHLLAAPACGRVEVVDIGLIDPADPAQARRMQLLERVPEYLKTGPDTLFAPTRAEVGRQLPVPGPADDKYSQGVVAIRAGSARYPGAAVLSVSAAVAATSGMVRFAGSAADATSSSAPAADTSGTGGQAPSRAPSAAADRVLAARPEVVCHPTVAEAGTAQAWVVGPGGGTDQNAIADIDAVLATGRPTLLDADALTVIATHPVLLRSATAPVLLTPHGGEFDRLTGGWDRADRAGELRRYVAGLRDRGIEATVLLKGRVTLIDNGETTYAVDAGSSWAATAGSGDVLSGITGALLAHAAAQRESAGAAERAYVQSISHTQNPYAGLELAGVAAAAATLHGEAARLAAHRHDVHPAGPGAGGPAGPGAPIGASDLLAAVPVAVATLRGV